MYLYRDIENQRAQIVKLESAAAKQSAELAAKRGAELAARQAVEDLRLTVQRSKSWRLTRPLRVAARLLGGSQQT
jgi:hypothetical protein